MIKNKKLIALINTIIFILDSELRVINPFFAPKKKNKMIQTFTFI